MASNISFLTNNFADSINSTDYVVLSGTENAQFPMTNLGKVFTTKVFKSTGPNVEFRVDLGAGRTIDTVALAGNTNDRALGITSATIEFSPTTVFSGATIISIDLSAEHNFGFKYFTEQSGMRYAKIVLTGASHCEISNLYVGSRTELSDNNFDTSSFEYDNIENFKAKKNNYGQFFIDKYNKTNSMSGVIKYVNLVEFETLQDIYAEVGNTTPLWFILDNEGNMSTDGSSAYLFSGYYYLSGSLNWKTVAPNIKDTQLKFIEVV